MEINGIAHTQLTVQDFEKSVTFYDSLLPFMGLRAVFRGKEFYYWVGGRTALGISRRANKNEVDKFDQTRVGLHHLCFRARAREDIDRIYQHLLAIKALVIRSPSEGPWAPGYYYVLFEDPNQIRLEVNHVPGKGLLKKGVKLNPAGDYR